MSLRKVTSLTIFFIKSIYYISENYIILLNEIAEVYLTSLLNRRVELLSPK